MKGYLKSELVSCLRELGYNEFPEPVFEKPRIAEHGDYTTNIAMVLAKKSGKNPLELAKKIVENLKIDKTLISKAEIAGPGFINFNFTDKYYHRQLQEILTSEGKFGRVDIGNGIKTQVEFVSANPTGPLTVGHGRGAVYGDTIARLLEWTNHRVTREYYFNNAGRQMRILGDSVRLRYLELLGEKIEFPEDYYQGEYIKEIAEYLAGQHGDALKLASSDEIFKKTAEQKIFIDIKKTLEKLDIRHDVYFNENTLYESGQVKSVLEALQKGGFSYEKDGAVWFKATLLGGEKDKVIVKNTGEPTYRLPDIAYHCDKLKRGFELVVDVLGADHIAAFPDVLAGLRALGCDASRVKVLIHQFVTIVEGGEVVKMSTRKANFITLDELIEEVGADIVRYFFLMRGIGSHLNFDLQLAKDQSENNPVYYLQYAYARIASIIRNAVSQGINLGKSVNLVLLNQHEEIDLIKLLIQFPDIIELAVVTFEPQRLTEYLHSLAGSFHKFYHVHRVITEDPNLTEARLSLCLAVKIVLKNGFSILGISAPEKM